MLMQGLHLHLLYVTLFAFLVLVELLGESCGELVSLLNYKKHNSLLHFNHGCIWVSRSFILNITF